PVFEVVEGHVLEVRARAGDLVVVGSRHVAGRGVWNIGSFMTTAIVLLSGGLDSATALAMSRAEGKVCHALSFRYGQRHDVELEAAARVARVLGAASHRVLTIDVG